MEPAEQPGANHESEVHNCELLRKKYIVKHSNRKAYKSIPLRELHLNLVKKQQEKYVTTYINSNIQRLLVWHYGGVERGRAALRTDGILLHGNTFKDRVPAQFLQILLAVHFGFEYPEILQPLSDDDIRRSKVISNTGLTDERLAGLRAPNKNNKYKLGPIERT